MAILNTCESNCHNVQTGSGVHPAFYLIGNGGYFPGSKMAWAWSWPLTSI